MLAAALAIAGVVLPGGAPSASSVEGAAPGPACAVPDGFPEGRILLFGEMHGSVEAPELVLRVACALSRSGPVAGGLEVPAAEQGRFDAYLASAGTARDAGSLMDSGFWRSGDDGRASEAVLGLIEGVRALRAEGRAISLFAFDGQVDAGSDRDLAIADGIRRFHARNPDTGIVALMGNLHAGQASMEVEGQRLTPSGALLASLQPVSILIGYPAGTTWACMPDCGVQRLDASKGAERGPGLRAGASVRGYTHTWVLPSITASPPASR